MTQPSYVTLKGITNYKDTQLMGELENNLKYWLDWSLLCIGGWTNVVSGETNAKAGSPDKLRYVGEQSYNSGQVWESARKDWVWESGIDYGAGLNNPINITGIYYNNNSIATGYYINYPLGRVVFSGTLATGSNIRANYSYRNVQVYKADDAPWWKELQFGSVDSSSSQFTQDVRTGDWAIGSYKRIQLPAIILETVPRAISRPYEIGNGSLWVEQDMLFHVLADNRQDRNNLTSMLFLQNDKIIWLFDTNIIMTGQNFPLDYRGARINGLLYPDLVSDTGYRYKKCRFTKTTTSEVESIYPNLYEGTVRSTLEVVFGEI